MTWHTIVVNKLGIERRSFIMDSNPGNEVWNYPVAGYDYSYFNPQTLESSHSLADSIVSVEVFTSDRFKRFRSANTRYVVGIMMDVFHPSLVNPQVGANNGKVPHTDSFIYDLELDENFDIVGGEWYEQKVRPKFLWTYNSGAKATTRDDSSLPDRWDLTTALPEVFATQAKKASLSGVVLSKVANALLDQSL
jgi:hypothetical protein